MAKPEIGSLGLGVDAFVGRSGEDAWVGVGGALDELWEDVVEELGEHLDWTGAGTAPSTTTRPPRGRGRRAADDEQDDATGRRRRAGATRAGTTPGVRTIAAAAAHRRPPRGRRGREFWEAVGILPVEIVVPEGAGLTLRCYVDDVARFLGRDGEIFLFDTPTELARFCAGTEEHDLTEIASWPEVADTDTPPLPADQDRYDLTELTEVLTEVADGAAGLVDHRALRPAGRGRARLRRVRGAARVEELLAPARRWGGPSRAASGSRTRRCGPDAAVLRPRGTRSSPSSAATWSSATSRSSPERPSRRSGRPRRSGTGRSSFRCCRSGRQLP